MAVQETSPLGRSYSVPSALRKASVSVSRKTSADPVVSSESALGQTTSLDRYNSLPIENSLDTTDGLNSRRTSTSFFSRIMTSDTSAAEQAELEIYRTINQIRRDLVSAREGKFQTVPCFLVVCSQVKNRERRRGGGGGAGEIETSTRMLFFLGISVKGFGDDMTLFARDS